MFQAQRPSSTLGSALNTIDLIYHGVVRSTRSKHRDAVLAIVAAILQNLVMLAVFFWFMEFMGLRRTAIRGDFLLYIMTGVFMFMTHVAAIGAITSAEGPTSPMMQHQPMNIVISIWSSALSALYRQVISMLIILAAYHLMWTPIEIEQPFMAFVMLLLAWFSGCAVGSVFLAAKPWAPGPMGIVQMTYQRISMFASGKMFVANQVPAKLVAVFSWSPLFHIIDQTRGYVFINYSPMKTNLTYPIVLSVILICFGLLLESKTRRHVSVSWTAGR